MQLPRLNLRSRRVLLPLLYRALAGRADASQAQLTQRRIEHLQAEGTELAKQLSELRARVGITRDKATKARQAATQSSLDLRIFMERYEEPKGRGGFLQPRLSPEQRATEQRKSELTELALHAEKEHQSKADAERATSQALEKVEQAAAHNRTARSQYASALADELAAEILGRLTEGLEQGWRAALGGSVPLDGLIAQTTLLPARELCLEQLESLRRSVRGDLLVATLIVLTELLIPAPGTTGTASARRALIELSALFEQHRDPAVRVIECFARWLDGQTLTLSDIGLLPGGHFTYPALQRFYELVRVLAGLGYDERELARADAPPEHAATLMLLHEYLRSERPAEDWQPLPSAALQDFARSGDPLQRLLAANMLLASDALEGVIEAGAADAAVVQGGRAASRLPAPQLALMDELQEAGFEAWPPASREPWLGELACHLLLAAKMQAPAWAYQQWLQESYGWPKSDLYWWTLSTLNADAALLRNIRRDAEQLFTVP